MRQGPAPTASRFQKVRIMWLPSGPETSEKSVGAKGAAFWRSLANHQISCLCHVVPICALKAQCCAKKSIGLGIAGS